MFDASIGSRKHLRAVAIGYVLLLHFVVVVVVWKSDLLTRAALRFGLTQPHQPPEITSHFERMLTYHERSAAIVPAGAVIFIGNSITQSLCVAAVAPNSVNYGIGSDTTIGVLARLPSYKPALQRASAIVLAIGINDLARRTDDSMVDNYRRILDALPDIPVVVSSIMPVDESVSSQMDGLNARISEINRRIRSLAETRANVTFLNNLSSLDIDSDGALDSAFHDGDGVHLNTVGNGIWVANLKNTLTQLNPQLMEKAGAGGAESAPN